MARARAGPVPCCNPAWVGKIVDLGAVRLVGLERDPVAGDVSGQVFEQRAGLLAAAGEVRFDVGERVGARDACRAELIEVSEHTPATATTVRSGATAATARATPAGALPCNVWASSAPSPLNLSGAIRTHPCWPA
jgi:hypothetical protein